MQFILTFTVPPATRDAAMARFLETGGQPPPGVRLLGRWNPARSLWRVYLTRERGYHRRWRPSRMDGATWWSSRSLRSWRIRRCRRCCSGRDGRRRPRRLTRTTSPRRRIRKTCLWRRKRPLERPNHLTKNWRERTRGQRGRGQEACAWGGERALTPRRPSRPASGADGSGPRSSLRLRLGMEGSVHVLAKRTPSVVSFFGMLSTETRSL